MKIIGITGKSGSGKSYIAKSIAEKMGATLFSFDEFSHLSIETETLKNFALNEFGNSVFDNGKINRKKVGMIAFANPEKLAKWNDLAETEMEKLIDEKLKQTTSNYIVFEYALLPLMKYFDMCDLKILITAENKQRALRVCTRDNIGARYFETRDTHAPEFDKFKFDAIIDNTNNDDFAVSKLEAIIKEKLWLEKPQ